MKLFLVSRVVYRFCSQQPRFCTRPLCRKLSFTFFVIIILWTLTLVLHHKYKELYYYYLLLGLKMYNLKSTFILTLIIVCIIHVIHYCKWIFSKKGAKYFFSSNIKILVLRGIYNQANCFKVDTYLRGSHTTPLQKKNYTGFITVPRFRLKTGDLDFSGMLYLKT